MKKRLCSISLAVSMLVSLALPASAAIPSSPTRAVYLGVQGYGTVTSAEKDSFQHRFNVDGQEVLYAIDTADGYALNDRLAEGGIYDLTLSGSTVTDVAAPAPAAAGTVDAVTPESLVVDGVTIPLTSATAVYEIATQAGGATVAPATVTAGRTVKVYGDPAQAVYLTYVSQPYAPPVSGTPGLRTLKNFLSTAMAPVGTTLYIYGGAWDWQDVGSAPEATSIGVAQSWIDFFRQQDASFTYRNNSDYARSYYPHKAYNQYFYAGADCSGYVGWVMYNVMNTVSGNAGYVQGAVDMAQTFAKTYGYGTFHKKVSGPNDFKVGDVFSMTGHVWICLGVCADGSMVILHSTPSNSVSGSPGGGVQLGAIGADENCEAYRLADYYNQTYYPQWSARYPTALKDASYYATSGSSKVGRFSWTLGTAGVTDPDGYAAMRPAAILADLFRDVQP